MGRSCGLDWDRIAWQKRAVHTTHYKFTERRQVRDRVEEDGDLPNAGGRRRVVYTLTVLGKQLDVSSLCRRVFSPTVAASLAVPCYLSLLLPARDPWLAYSSSGLAKIGPSTDTLPKLSTTRFLPRPLKPNSPCSTRVQPSLPSQPVDDTMD